MHANAVRLLATFECRLFRERLKIFNWRVWFYSDASMTVVEHEEEADVHDLQIDHNSPKGERRQSFHCVERQRDGVVTR